MKKTLQDLPIGLKIFLSPALALCGLLVVAVIGWFASRSVSDELGRIGGEGVERVVRADAIALRMTDLHRRLYQSLAWEAVGMRAEKIKALDDSIATDMAGLAKSLDAASASAAAAQQPALVDLSRGFKAYAKIAADTLDMKSVGVANAATFVATLDSQYQGNQSLVAAFVAAQVRDIHAGALDAESGVKRQGSWIAAVSAALLVVCVGLSFAFMRSITRPLASAASLASGLAQGDLTGRESDAGRDATGRVLSALDAVGRNLTSLVADVRTTAEEISTASAEIASGNSDLSARTEGSASALQQAAASVEQLAATIRSNADSARGASTLAQDASAVAREGGQVVTEVVRTMDAINAQAKQIAEIIGTIDGIAFQTNILALNAAVEAARAGEQGRGFAVVASEVRMLAQRSGEAAREIRALIGSSVERIDAGVTQVQAAGRTMERIVDATLRVCATVDGISHAAAEQASGIAQVNRSVIEMDRSTQQNAAMVEEATAATEALSGQAQRLVQMLTRFRTA